LLKCRCHHREYPYSATSPILREHNRRLASATSHTTASLLASSYWPGRSPSRILISTLATVLVRCILPHLARLVKIEVRTFKILLRPLDVFTASSFSHPWRNER